MTRLTPFQQDMVSKIRSLRRLTADTGFRTNRSQTTLLGGLEPLDLAAVVQALEHGENENENAHITAITR